MRMEIDKELLEDVFAAYYDARKNKRNTINQLEFEMNLEANLVELASQLQSRTYKVGRSVCFIVEMPVKREIFAADFRDRVVHHLLFNYINPVFDKRLITDCYSCRKGYGTSFGIDRIEHHMRSVTDNYTREAYVLKLDLQGYFMSMRKSLLYEKIVRLLTSRKNRKDKHLDLELFLIREIIFNDPTEECWVKGSPHDWNGLPDSKSLFHSPKDCGLPIGNLTSQLFSNIYLSDFDNYIKRELKMKHYGRYVDDFFLMHESKEYLQEIMGKLKTYLKKNHGLTIHPRKIYLQEVKKGVDFLGAYLKPHRRYIKNRTLKDVRKAAHKWSVKLEHKESLNATSLLPFLSVVNSYYGYMAQFKTYGFRRKLWDRNPEFFKHFYRNHIATKARFKEKYRPRDYETAPDLFPEELAELSVVAAKSK